MRGIAITSKFKPFSYEERVKPLLEYTKVYNETMDLLTALSATNTIQDIVNRELDDRITGVYNLYYNSLADLSELVGRGLTPTTRRQLLQKKLDYASLIQPILRAHEARLADITRLKSISDKSNGRVRFTRLASDIPLYDYMSGEVQDFGQVNLDNVMQEGILMGKGISSRYFNTEEGRAFRNDYLVYRLSKGLSPEMEETTIQEMINSGNYPTLANAYMLAMNRYGADLYSDVDLIAISDSFMLGLSAGMVYEQDNKLMEDWRRKAAVHAYYSGLLNPNPTDTGSLSLNPVNIYSLRERELTMTDFNDYERYILFDNDGNPSLTNLGILLAATPERSPRVPGGGTGFLKFLKETVGIEGIGSDEYTRDYIRTHSLEIAEKIIAAREQFIKLGNQYDATRYTAFEYGINSTNLNAATDAFLRSARTFLGADFDSGREQFVPTEDTYTEADLREGKYKVTANRYSEYGNVVIMQNDKGNTISLIDRGGVHPTMEANRDLAIRVAGVIRKSIVSGEITEQQAQDLMNAFDIKVPIGKLSKEDIAYLANMHSRLLLDAAGFNSQIYVTNKTEPQTFKPVGM